MALSDSDKEEPQDTGAREAPTATAAPPEVPDELTALRQKLEEKTKEAEENYDRLVRLAADMENLKKRQDRERAELLRFSNENLIKELLPVVDNLERALEHGRQLEASAPWLDGVELVHQGFLKALERFGVRPLDSVGQQFDPAFHNAMMQEETTEVPDCSVLRELQKGYLLHQRLLRPAMVVVARNTQQTENTSCQTHSKVQED